jgi:hypothetical protein
VQKSQGGTNIAGKRIAAARGLINPPITQEELSGRLALQGIQLDRAAIAKIESNRRRILDYELRAFAVVLSVSAAWLLGDER